MTNSMSEFEMFLDLIRSGNLQAVQDYFKPEYLEMETIDQTRPIHVACKYGHEDIVRFLYNQKCNMEACDRNNWRPIHFACNGGYYNLVKYLCDVNCILYSCDNIGWRALHHACQNSHMEVIKLLLDRKANVESCDRKGWRPLHIACQKRNVELVRYLLERKCSVNSCDKTAWRAAHFASDAGYLEILEILHEYQCYFDCSDKRAWRPIHLACRKGHLEIVKWLCEKNINKTYPDKEGWQPMHHASDSGHADVVEYLCEQNCDRDFINKAGYRPIHLACKNGHLNVVKVLYRYNCAIQEPTKEMDMGDDNKSNKNFMPMTPLDLARTNNHRELAEYIDDILTERLMAKIDRANHIKCHERCLHKDCFKSLYAEDSMKEKLVGNGGFGQVYSTVDRDTHLEIAIKIIRLSSDDSTKTSNCLEENINEYRSLIKHDNIVRYYGALTRCEGTFIFMEYISGDSLHKKIYSSGGLSPKDVYRYSQHILRGLAFLHEKGIIHRDVKAKNILLDKQDNAKLCDFGLSLFLESLPMESIRKIDDGLYSKERLNQTFCGTPNYVAPEMLSGSCTFSVDIWSFGATVIEMVTGKPPFFEHETSAAIIFQVYLTKSILFEPGESTPKALITFVKKATNPNHKERDTASMLIDYLEVNKWC